MKFMVLVFSIFIFQFATADNCATTLNSIIATTQAEKLSLYFNFLIKKNYISSRVIDKIINAERVLIISDFEFINVNESQKNSLRSVLVKLLANITENDWSRIKVATSEYSKKVENSEAKILEVKEKTEKILRPQIVSEYKSKLPINHSQLIIASYQQKEGLIVSSSGTLKLLDLDTFAVNHFRNKNTHSFVLKLNLDGKDFIPKYDNSKSGYHVHETSQNSFMTMFDGHRLQQLNSLSFKDKLSKNKMIASTILDTPGVRPVRLGEFQGSPVFFVPDGMKVKVLDAFTLKPLRRPIPITTSEIDEWPQFSYFKFKGEDYLFLPSNFAHSNSSNFAMNNYLVHLASGKKMTFGRKVYNISPTEHHGELYFVGQRFISSESEGVSQLEVYSLADLKEAIHIQKIAGPTEDYGQFLTINSPTLGNYIFWIDIKGVMNFMDFSSKAIIFQQKIDSSPTQHYINYRDKDGQEYILVLWDDAGRVIKIRLTN